MKKLITLVSLVILVGCTTSQQRASYNTLFSLETATTSTYSYYIDGVIAGTYPTNDVPKISKDYNLFQASIAVALDGVQYNTNALAPLSLQTEAQDIINLINQAKGGK